MRVSIFLLIVFLIVSSGTLHSQVKMEIEGPIVIDDSQDANPSPGTIRFNQAKSDFEGWNGLFWVSLTGGITLGTISDIDGHMYKTVTIGDQEWMGQNLRTTHYRDGSPIPLVGDSALWITIETGAFCWYDNDDQNEVPYGKLYNWYAVKDERGLCPHGWHVPSEQEWLDLIDFLGGMSVAGGKMKEPGTLHWSNVNREATNSSGFTGLPGGFRYIEDSSFYFEGLRAQWWSTTEYSPQEVWNLWLSNHLGSALLKTLEKNYGMSVRCLKN